MSGRGAWPVSGAGGTKKYKDATRPGPYYFLGTGAAPDGRVRTNDEYAVYRAVVAYQAALNRRINAGLATDGLFGERTSEAVTVFQNQNSDQTGTPWGGIGPDTSKALLYPDLKKVVADNNNKLITPAIVSGTVNHESMWDVGAVGFLDDSDLGLAQINGTAHPDMTRAERLGPLVSFQFVIDYYDNALAQLNNNVRDAIASYNLGIGGAKRWISQNRPQFYTPQGETRARNVWEYIDSVLAG